MRKLRYGHKNDIQFGEESGAYRCHSCGCEKNFIDDVRMIKTDTGPEAELTLSCAHCTTLSVFQICSKSGHIYMGVVAHAIDTRDEDAEDQRQFELNLSRPMEWP